MVRRRIAAVFVLAIFPAALSTTASAQEELAAAAPLPISASAFNVRFTDDHLGAPARHRSEPDQKSWTGPLLVSLQVATFATQMIDVHSTRHAMKHGAAESNPVVSGVVKNRAAFIGLKTAMSAGLVVVTHQVGKRNKMGAIVMAAAINSAYLIAAAHNYRVAGSLQ